MQLDVNLYELFAARARGHPEAVAIVDDEGTTTYGELAMRAAQVSAALVRRGIQPESTVGVFMSRTAEMVAVLLGILKSGGAYVPLDPENPPARRRRVLSNCGCQWVIADRPWSTPSDEPLPLAANGDPIEFIDAQEIQPSVATMPLTLPEGGGSRLAYVIYTSGSTGEPKGVEIEHRSVVNLLHAVRGLFDFSADDCFLAASTIGFDISVIEIFLPLTTGGRLLLRDRSCWLDPRKLAADIRRHAVSAVQTGPATWDVLLAEVSDFPRVRVAISTAEAIGRGLALRLVAQGEHVWNLYGPTEATVWATAYRLTPETINHRQHSSLSVPIGYPLANTNLQIIDTQGELVAEGERGELCIGGLGVARGYRNLDDLTKRSFGKVGADGDRYYRTGDLVGWSVDGALLYYGRTDDQMKIRGVRIDPGEVEVALLTHPDVRQAAVTWYETPSQTLSVMAAVVPQPGTTPTPQALRRWLEARLPAQMLPSSFVLLDSIPLTPSGKIDRSALRQAAAVGFRPAAANGVSASRTESRLIDIWCRLLRLDSVTGDDHFFTVGGDSLAAVRLLAQVEMTFGARLSVKTVFENPTLAQFATVIDGACQKRSTRGLFTAGLAGARGMLRLFAGTAAESREARSPPAVPRRSAALGLDEILCKQREFLKSWGGRRAATDSMIFTRNGSDECHSLFWCLQGYREFTQLSDHLGPEQPIHGMRSGYLIVDHTRQEETEVLASYYAAEMLALQPSGSFLLGGNCQGGTIMRRVADKLLAQGRTVSLLILMEQRSFPPYDGRVALIFGRESHLNPYVRPGVDPDRMFRESYPSGFAIHLIAGAHGEFFESPNIEGLAVALKSELGASSSGWAQR